MARSALPILVLAALAGCARPATTVVESLSPAETFDWCGQPIEFQPPPDRWLREGYGDGGLSGIWCVKKGGHGEAIAIGEHRIVAERDQRIVLGKLLADLPRLEEREVARALGIARWRTDDPVGRPYRDAASAGNEAIDRALDAYYDHRPSDVRWELESALGIAQRTRLTLADVLERVEFRPEKTREPQIYKVIGRDTLEVAGEPAVSVDYTVETIGGPRRAREIYVMHDNHLFVAHFIGLATSLPLFDRVVATISFPSKEPVAVHGR